ncbi:hypothetical protein MJL48_33545, partial [Salmonella enterica subsp. enterica serovar Kentucky]|nr:hypothetical protein [Salmonella enterica subsp. enterica serovar Kentucky]
MSAKTLYEKLVESHTIRELDNEGHVLLYMGVTIAAAADRPALIVAEIFRERIDQVREQLPLLQQRRFAPP